MAEGAPLYARSAFHKFPRKGRLYHGTSCRALPKILKDGLEPGSYLTDDMKEAEFYAKRKSALVQKVEFDTLEARGNPKHRVPKEPPACVFEVKCGADLEWYEAVSDPKYGRYDYFVSHKRVPAKCLRLRKRIEGFRRSSP